jgi:uncharacterized protein (DUF2062 family)
MELIYQLRTEGDSPVQQSWALAIGIFIGCTPLYGLHLPMCIVAAKLLRLSRLKMFLATNLNNPLLAPFLIFGEIQLGSLVRRGSFYPLSIEAFKQGSLGSYAADLAIGSLVVGVLLGLLVGLITYNVLIRGTKGSYRRLLVEETGRRYLDVSLTSWEVVRNQLHFDPIYLDIVTGGLLPDQGWLVDIGTGRGILLALLETYRSDRFSDQRPPDCAAAPRELSLLGLESRRRVAAVARKAGLPVKRVNLKKAPIPRCQCVVMIDVLRRFGRKLQEDLLHRARIALPPGGTLLLRETDDDRSWRFFMTAAYRRLLLILRGRLRQRIRYRSQQEWIEYLESLGFTVTARTLSQGNTLLCATVTQPPADQDPPPLDTR